VQREIVAFTQRAARESALATCAAGFPGLTLDGDRERAWVNREAAERALDRIGLAYLRAERGAGTPPPEQLNGTVEQLRVAEQTRPRVLKIELLGPVSMALEITDEQERPLAYDPALREALTQHLSLRSTWVRDLIDSAGARALILLDEPFLDALGSPFCPLSWAEGGELLARALADLPGQRGVCAPGDPNWAEILALPLDIVFFDAYEHSAGLVQAAGHVREYLEGGGALGWGIVPTDTAALAQEHAATLARRFASSVEYLAAAGGIAPEQIAARSLISTSTGLAHLPTPQAAQAVTLCAETATAARTLFGLEP
jgi:hypothetical protein